jgi:hypothetical protein
LGKEEFLVLNIGKEVCNTELLPILLSFDNICL